MGFDGYSVLLGELNLAVLRAGHVMQCTLHIMIYVSSVISTGHMCILGEGGGQRALNGKLVESKTSKTT